MTTAEHWANDMVWRVGTDTRTIYVILSVAPSDIDVMIGVMDSPGLATEVVASHNLRLQKDLVLR